MIFLIIFLILFFWVFREIKQILFWVYLWQLKEYHIGRFKAHFSTYRGKHLILNKIYASKIILLALLVFFVGKIEYFSSVVRSNMFFPSIILSLLFLAYLLEFGLFLLKIKRRRIIRPVFTKKVYLILGLSIVFIFIMPFLAIKTSISSFFGFVFVILLLDIFTPLIVSFVVILIEPLAIYWRKKLMERARRKIEKFKDLTVIGITGSYGKTSTKEFLSQILSTKFKVLRTNKHQNSEVGISRCILNNLKPGHEIFVCEMGAYQKGGIKMLADIVRPKIGILTGINEQHLATFGSQENIVKTKYELIESLPKDGVAIFNGENNYCLDLYQKTENIDKKIIFEEKRGLGEDLWAENIKVEKEKLSFEVVSKGGERMKIEVGLLGKHNIQNILLAIAVARYLGMSFDEIKEGVKKIRPLEGSLRLVKIDNMNILDATYSANPNGVLSHLDYLNLWEGKKVIVMPCLIELGKMSNEVHQEIGRKITEICNLGIVTKKECFGSIKEGAEEVNKKSVIEFSENPCEIYKKIKSFSGGNDIILLESRLPKKLLSYLKIKK